MIDKIMAIHIRQSLDHLKLATLYDFLGLNPHSSAKALTDRADEIYRENQRLGKTDADASARNTLAGICKSLFPNDREKAKYDDYLAVEAMEKLRPHLELAGADTFISREELDALIQLARQRGVSAEDARAYIEHYAMARKWEIQGDSVTQSAVAATRQELNPPELPPLPEQGLPRGSVEWLKSAPDRLVTNVTSKSFGIRIIGPQGREVVANLICINDSVPTTGSLRIETQEKGLSSMELHCMENTLSERQVALSDCKDIGHAIVEFGRPLPRGSIVEISFDLGPDGLLTLRAMDYSTGKTVRAEFRTGAVLTREQLESAMQRNLAQEIGQKSTPLGQPLEHAPQEAPKREKPLPKRDQVFISYSRKDKIWLDRVQLMLKPLVRKGLLSLWDDTSITPGKKWREEIESALASAKVAIFLVSIDFIASDFVAKEEIPPLLRAAEQEGLVILWLCLNDCLYEETEISRYQAIHDPAKPLSRANWEKVLADLARQVKAAIQSVPLTS